MRRSLGLFLLLTSCAGQTSMTSWEEDERDGVIRPKEQQETVLEPPKTLPRAKLEITPGVSLEDAKNRSLEMEMALLRFVTKRRQLAKDLTPRKMEGGQPVWPRQLDNVFVAAIEALELGLEGHKGVLARRVLIQARVTLEVELENTETKFGAAPTTVANRIARVYSALSDHLRAPSQFESEREEATVELSWPVSPIIVTSPFGYRRDPILGRKTVRFHAGVDLGGDNGVVISSAGIGRVVSAGWLGGHGRAVIIQHPGGLQTMYAHLKQIIVSAGDDVDAGSPLGMMGSSGRSTGPHLHFEVRRGGVPLDPLEVLSGNSSTITRRVRRATPDPSESASARD